MLVAPAAREQARRALRTPHTETDRDHDHRFSTIFLLLLESSTNFLSLPKETPYANVTRYSPRNFRCEFFKAEEVKINTSPHGEHVGSVQPQ